MTDALNNLGMGGIFALLLIREMRIWREKETAKKNGKSELEGHALICEKLDVIDRTVTADHHLLTVHHGQVGELRTQFIDLKDYYKKMGETMDEVREHTRDTKNALIRMEQNGRRA